MIPIHNTFSSHTVSKPFKKCSRLDHLYTNDTTESLLRKG